LSLTPVPAGHIATIVISLEMLAPPAAVAPARSALRLERWPAPVSRDRYRALFRHIGEPWLWRGRLVIDDTALAGILDASTTEVHAATRRDGVAVGLLELDFAVPGACEIAYFALVPELAGQQLGRWMMAEALARAWRGGIGRVWLHTCTLDHPSALNFYRASGFRATERRIETFPDPRLSGVLDRAAAPHVPLFDAS